MDDDDDLDYAYVQGHRVPRLDDVELSDDEYDRWRNRACRACGRAPVATGDERPSWDKHDACIANLPGVVFACCGHGTIKIEGWRDRNAIVHSSPVAGGTRVRYDGCYLVFDDGTTLYGRAARAAMEILGGTPPPEPDGDYTAGGLTETVIGPIRA